MARDKLATIHRILDTENRLLERSDQKAISMLSILGVFMVFFIVNLRVIPVNAFTVTLLTMYIICALSAILSLIMTLRPRIEKSQDEGDPECPKGEPAFYMGICRYSKLSDYRKAIEELVSNDDNLPNIYIRQVFSLARINATKNKFLQRGMLFVVVALMSELILVVYLFANYMGTGIIPKIG